MLFRSRGRADVHGRSDGYEETKWADIAAAVDIGSTALYHYFESKQHCLFEIMAKAVADFRERFDRITAAHDDWTDALIAVLQELRDDLGQGDRLAEIFEEANRWRDHIKRS